MKDWTIASLAGLGSAMVLAGALFFQYGVGLAPCELCIWQRWPHGVAVVLGLLAWFIPALWIAALGASTMAVSVGLGLYHTGVERQWWEGPQTCSGTGDIGSLSAGQLLDQILAAPVVRCTEVAWEMFGLSMASWNALASLGLLALWLPGEQPCLKQGEWLRELFPQTLWLAVELHCGQDDDQRLAQLREAGQMLNLPLVAAGDVHMHARGRRALQDTMTAVRHHCTLAEAGLRLFPNGERHLRSPDALAEIYPADLLAETQLIAARCTFELGQLRYQYPHELVPQGETPASWLRELTEQGIRWRWPAGVTDKVRLQIDKELLLITFKEYESYFLTVHDIVRFARERHILCQGRGSAANSAVCFALGITEIDPAKSNLLFERFLSRERNEPPDIDVDFEHDRREEVIQYVFRRYGRHRAALTAVASSYRGAGAIRDVAKALGMPADQINALADCCGRWSSKVPSDERLKESGFDPAHPLLHRVLKLTEELIGFPRHLSQHPGGFVISEQPLHTLVPVENAAMDERTIIQWDKDDLDLVGLLKVDILALLCVAPLICCVCTADAI